MALGVLSRMEQKSDHCGGQFAPTHATRVQEG